MQNTEYDKFIWASVRLFNDQDNLVAYIINNIIKLWAKFILYYLMCLYTMQLQILRNMWHIQFYSNMKNMQDAINYKI